MLKTEDEFVVGKHSIGWIDSDFKKYTKDIAEFEKKMNTVGTYQKLPRTMSGDEMQSELNVPNSTLGDVLSFIENPPEGVKDGWSNIFLFEKFVVGVDWDSGGGHWRVVAYGRGGSWRNCGRVFSPASSSVAGSCALEPSGILTLITEIEERTAKIKKLLQ